MQIKMLAAGIAPDYYEIDGETITAHVGDQSDSFDLSGMPDDATLNEVDPVGGVPPIRAATRTDGELYVTLAQRVGAGHWSESDWFPADQYDPDAVHVLFDDSKAFAGEPTAWTREGQVAIQPNQEG